MDVKVHNEAQYRFGPFVVNPAKRELLREGVPVTLRYRLFDTLLVFLRSPGRLVTKDELLEAIWPGRYIEESSLTQAIYALRKALGEEGETQYIVTAPGKGYSFVVRVEHLGPSPPIIIETTEGGLGALPAPANVSPANAFSLGRPVVAVVAIAVALVLVLAASVYFVSRQPTSPPAAPPPPNTLVLADFQNFTADTTLSTVLEKVLEIDLAQSPFVSVMSRDRIADTLKLMERPTGAIIDPALAREICARNLGRAFLSGTIAQLGSRYFIALQSADCTTGRSISQEKLVVTRKEDLPGAVDGLAVDFRKSLSESPSTIGRFDVPIAQATTSSFEALKAFSLGERSRQLADISDAITLFRHAIELDPQFAMAYDDLATCYFDRQEDLAGPWLEKAFALRGRASEIEKLSITANYYHLLGNWAESERAYRTWAETYPRDWRPRAYLAKLLTTMARYPEAIATSREALRLDPDNSFGYVVLTRALKRASRFTEAREIGLEAVRKRLDGWEIHGLLYEIGFAQNDPALMNQQVALERNKPTECWMLDYEADSAAANGQLRLARSLYKSAIAAAFAQGGDATEVVSDIYADSIETLAHVGLKQEALALAHTAPGLNQNDDGPFAIATTGDSASAGSLSAALGRRYPDSTQVNAYYRPMTQAAIDLGNGKPRDAIVALQPAMPYEMAEFDISSLLGQAYLALGAAQNAATEYRQIIANRGVDTNNSLYPLAWLGLARALHMEHREAESRAAYNQLFAFWRHADGDLPVLVQAKAEYAILPTSPPSLSGG